MSRFKPNVNVFGPEISFPCNCFICSKVEKVLFHAQTKIFRDKL